jgi:glycosyltransferase involved in cell wall biosynthesis
MSSPTEIPSTNQPDRPRAAPTISVVIPTRNRAEHVLECTNRILKTDGFLELVVVDQSDDGSTESALSGIADSRLKYVRTATRGATNARNVGIVSSRGDVVAFTDDDCRVADDWVSRIASIFANDAEAAVVCGRVKVPKELQSQGWAAEFEPAEREWRGRFPRPGGDWGITANMAVRRDVLTRVGFFDPFLGPGAPLLCGEEPDLLFRVLRSGLKVVNAAEVQVDHLGIRSPGAQTRDLMRSYSAGTAAAFLKHVRLGDRRALRLYLRFMIEAVWRVVRSAFTGERPAGFHFMIAAFRGSLLSLRFRVDPRHGIYVASGDAMPVEPVLGATRPPTGASS